MVISAALEQAALGNGASQYLAVLGLIIARRNAAGIPLELNADLRSSS